MDGLRIVAPAQAQHRDALIDLASKTFGRYWSFRRYCLDGYVVGAPYDWEASRVGFVGETMVTHFGVWDFTMRVGVSRLRVAGIGAVATHDDYRKRGFMRNTILESLAAQAAAGYDLSLLFGIQNFYNKFKYRRAWSDETITVNRRRLSRLPVFDPSVDGERFEAEDVDIPAFSHLSNHEFESTTGTFVRPNYRTNRQPVSWKALTVRSDGALDGYIVYEAEDGLISLIDHAGEPRLVLAALRRAVEEQSADGVRFLGVPKRSRLGMALRLGDAEFRGRYVQEGGAMARIVNLRSTVEKLCPELSRRLATSGFAEWTGSVSIEYGDRERVLLGIDTGRVAVVPDTPTENRIETGEEFVRLVVGGEDPEILLAGSHVRVAGAGGALLRSLFPPRDPTIPPWDRF